MTAVIVRAFRPCASTAWVAVAMAACGSGKPGAAAGGAASAPQAPPMPNGSKMMPTGKDSAAIMAGKGTKAARDSAALRDSAFGPKFTVDSTGKVVPIKKP